MHNDKEIYLELKSIARDFEFVNRLFVRQYIPSLEL